jgi:hypothetical protein
MIRDESKGQQLRTKTGGPTSLATGRSVRTRIVS